MYCVLQFWHHLVTAVLLVVGEAAPDSMEPPSSSLDPEGGGVDAIAKPPPLRSASAPAPFALAAPDFNIAAVLLPSAMAPAPIARNTMLNLYWLDMI